jgi:uncharacterized protein (TIGR02569 family)
MLEGRPDPVVAAAFGLRGEPLPLSGGQRTAWRFGDVVLKPLDTEPVILEWQERLLHRLDGRDDFRVAPPRRSVAGELVVGGWTAWRFEAGCHRRARWPEIIRLASQFAGAVADLRRPAFLDQRQDPWAIGDRVAWAELAWQDVIPPTGPPVKHLSRLAAACRPIRARSRLIHGDLTGNVLFADGRPPLILDISPYWRPVALSAAIVVADALVFEGADASLVGQLPDGPDALQYLLRALMFRAVVDRLTRPAEPLRPDDADPYLPAVELAVRLAG